MENKHRPQRIAVTGASGLLGRSLVRLLAASGYAVIAGLHQSCPDLPSTVTPIELDLLDPVSVASFVDFAEADWIVHAAALTDVDRCERKPELAFAINTEATRVLADAVSRSAGRLVFLSTDYVFDGTAGPCAEDAVPRPINVYGRTKLEAERVVQSSAQDHVIIRSASFLGIGGPGRPTFAEKMVEVMLSSPPYLGAVDQRSNITPVGFLASAILEIIESGRGGLRHVAGIQVLSRYDFALRLARLFGLPDHVVRAVEYADLKRLARRPLNGGLITRFPLATPQVSLDGALAIWKEAFLRSRSQA